MSLMSGKMRRQNQNQSNFCKFRRLNPKRSKPNPSLGPVDLYSNRRDQGQNKEKKARSPYPPTITPQPLQINECGVNSDDQGQSQPNDLLEEQLLCPLHCAGAEEHDQTHGSKTQSNCHHINGDPTTLSVDGTA